MKAIAISAGTVLVLVLGSFSVNDKLEENKTAEVDQKCETNCCAEQPICCPK